MSNKTPQATGIARAPDCVTEVRMGNTILTVSGYFKQSATETAADKMAKVIAAEAVAGTLRKKIPKSGVDSFARLCYVRYGIVYSEFS